MWTLITGAGSGIGRALALELANRRQALVLVGRRLETLESTASQVRDRHPNATIQCIACDLATASERDQLASQLQKLGEPLHSMVHCAGVGVPASSLSAFSANDLTTALSVNVVAPMALTVALLPMIKQADPSARMVLIGAGMDTHVQPGTGNYGISKMALKRLFYQLQKDLEQEQVSLGVALLQPGVVDTPGLRQHIQMARDCGLPHAGWLQSQLDDQHALTAEQAASALSFMLMDMPDTDFHGHEHHARKLVDDLSFQAS